MLTSVGIGASISDETTVSHDAIAISYAENALKSQILFLLILGLTAVRRMVRTVV